MAINYNFYFKIEHDQAHSIIRHNQIHGQNEIVHQDLVLLIVMISYHKSLFPSQTFFQITIKCSTFTRKLALYIIFTIISILRNCSKFFTIDGD